KTSTFRPCSRLRKSPVSAAPTSGATCPLVRHATLGLRVGSCRMLKISSQTPENKPRRGAGPLAGSRMREVHLGRGKDARAYLCDAPDRVDEDHAIVRHVLRQLLVERGERLLHLVLLVKLRGLAARLAPGRGDLRWHVEDDREIGPHGVLVDRANPVDG